MVAVRQNYLDLNLPSFVWKLLVGDEPTVEDLEGVDMMLHQTLERLRNIEAEVGREGETGNGGRGGRCCFP